ncbi:GNAT family N-acetyltransferase [Rufibacter hautae]|uniref:GNAT family N-acetyltransferase n=1 Tax=Rufibacter hautae TaxID=2595005 RepID=A0A5B6TF38_9BACT|nr:GNAT family N-acetyltransferase [Rufibacter hautae]KAA3437890.1 GNAT family N-acetyltransferase [Rufibacter hautae]
MPAKVEIKEIPAAQTWHIRHEVMWPDKPLAFVQLPEDETGTHFGLYVDQELMSVISLFIEHQQAQFRKFATLTAFQKQGFGRMLLEHVFAFASGMQITTVWCHARASAAGFYLKAGMRPVVEPFLKNGIDYVRMEKAMCNS